MLKQMRLKVKYLNITNSGTTTALTAVENKISNFSSLVNNTKFREILNEITTDHDDDKYINTQEFNKLTSENFTARLKQANLER